MTQLERPPLVTRGGAALGSTGPSGGVLLPTFLPPAHPSRWVGRVARGGARYWATGRGGVAPSRHGRLSSPMLRALMVMILGVPTAGSLGCLQL